ncbi:glycoside hydrolase family 16 protein [Botrimarina hoheduenensis]|uniref:Glucan endo-1,3-beta-glucosidase A1 n=1 Tax=Botrimarina hoheduenensis TaxID=2528000 RepID=A0A5C5VXJ4_9BACT|nr:glycoside hydrolase family 16 protein [Botrimarina hoheduenensis]TWT43160.1 Glucan endo-1,3-beta-glucosidase A1 precursor [Botrimarina hoheduenensis]
MLIASQATQALAGVVIVPGWGAPIFEDNFDTGGINYGVWEVANRANDANNEQQYYHPNQVSVADGKLHLRADRDPNWTYGKNYNSGLVRTWQEWSYGRFEARAKLPYGQGFWPAIWLLPRTASWPAGGEIDIMEARGDAPYGMSSALHWGWDFNSRQYRSQWYESGANFQAGYHDYAVEWEVGVVRFYVDGVNHFTLYEPDVGIPGTPKSLILNLAVGGDYSGFPDGSTPLPSQFDIDYVRVWQRPEIIAPPVSLVEDPGFEQGGGALNRWGMFGNSLGNVSSDYGTPLDGERSLKLYGQFSNQVNYSGVFQSIPTTEGLLLSASVQSLTRSEDSIAGTDNQALMKLEFYSQTGAEYGSEHFLGESSIIIADRFSSEDVWSNHELQTLTPAGAVEARLALVFLQPATNDPGSLFIDSVTLSATLAGDYNLDGTVDSADYTVWRDGLGTAFTPSDYNRWANNYGATIGPGSQAVPEPLTGWLAALAGSALGCRVSRSQPRC